MDTHDTKMNHYDLKTRNRGQGPVFQKAFKERPRGSARHLTWMTWLLISLLLIGRSNGSLLPLKLRVMLCSLIVVFRIVFCRDPDSSSRDWLFTLKEA